MTDILSALKPPFCDQRQFDVGDIHNATGLDYPFLKLEIQNGDLKAFHAENLDMVHRADLIDWFSSLQWRADLDAECSVAITALLNPQPTNNDKDS